jgi:hypothetical protein
MTNIHRVIHAHNEVSQKEAKIHADYLILVAAMRFARLKVDPTHRLFQDRNASYSGDNYAEKPLHLFIFRSLSRKKFLNITTQAEARRASPNRSGRVFPGSTEPASKSVLCNNLLNVARLSLTLRRNEA